MVKQKTKFGMVDNKITSVNSNSAGTNIQINYDIHKMFEKCYFELESNIKLELKWYICFRILFYLDQIHDFIEPLTSTNENKIILEYAMWKGFHTEIQKLLNDHYPPFMGSRTTFLNSSKTENDIGNYYKKYGECIMDIFYTSKTNYEIDNGVERSDEIFLLMGVQDPNNELELQGFFEYYINWDKKNQFPVLDISKSSTL